MSGVCLEWVLERGRRRRRRRSKEREKSEFFFEFFSFFSRQKTFKNNPTLSPPLTNPQVRELPVAEGHDLVPRGKRVGQSRLPPSSASARVDEGGSFFRAENHLGVLEALLEERREPRVAVVLRGPVHRPEDVLVDVDGSGDEEVVAAGGREGVRGGLGGGCGGGREGAEEGGCRRGSRRRGGGGGCCRRAPGRGQGLWGIPFVEDRNREGRERLRGEEERREREEGQKEEGQKIREKQRKIARSLARARFASSRRRWSFFDLPSSRAGLLRPFCVNFHPRSALSSMSDASKEERGLGKGVKEGRGDDGNGGEVSLWRW